MESAGPNPSAGLKGPGIGSASLLIGRHENRKAEPGEMMQRLIDADQRPEPWMFQRHTERRGAKPLGAVDRDVNGEIDKGDEPEPRRDDRYQHQRHGKMHQAMREQRQRPAGLLVLADRHPGIL